MSNLNEPLSYEQLLKQYENLLVQLEIKTSQCLKHEQTLKKAQKIIKKKFFR